MITNLQRNSRGFVGFKRSTKAKRAPTDERAEKSARSKSSAKSRPRNPYTDSHRRWNERFGFDLDDAVFWRKIALCSGFLSMLFAVLLAMFLVAPRVTPFVIGTDSAGEVGLDGLAQSVDPDSERLQRALVLSFATSARRLALEGQDTGDYGTRLISMVRPGTPAARLVQNLVATTRGAPRAQAPLVAFRSINANRDANGKWAVEWVERIPQADGATSVRQWRTTLATSGPADVDDNSNPFGFFVESLDWGPAPPKPESRSK